MNDRNSVFITNIFVYFYPKKKKKFSLFPARKSIDKISFA